nr:MobA/MobL family protein [Escherichia coli]
MQLNRKKTVVIQPLPENLNSHFLPSLTENSVSICFVSFVLHWLSVTEWQWMPLSMLRVKRVTSVIIMLMFLCSTRRLSEEGFKDKTRELDDFKSGEVNYWRSAWSEMTNRHLEKSWPFRAY